MNTKQASAKALEAHAPKISPQQKRIFQLIRTAGYPVTRKMIEDWTGWKHNVVTARINELVNDVIVIKETTPTRSKETGTLITTYTGFDSPEERIQAICRKRKEVKEKLDDLVNDFLDGKLHGYTKEIVEKKKTSLEKQLKKIEAL